MDYTQAKELQLEDKVMWDGNEGDVGEVVDVVRGWLGWRVKIMWEFDGQVGWIDMKEMARIEVVEEVKEEVLPY